MKDLFVYTADADAEAVFSSILERHQALGIRKIIADVDRYPGRDCGMFNHGPDIACLNMKKQKYSKIMLVWDFHGSGRDDIETADKSAAEVQNRLDRRSWTNNSLAVVLCPELEEWLWYSPVSVATNLGWTLEKLDHEIDKYAKTIKKSRDYVLKNTPKETWENLKKKVARQTISPRDFASIAKNASLAAWGDSPSFALIKTTLITWFPAPAPDSVLISTDD
ncbi:MAG: hypothetical protein WCK65_02010 [Rhodospirillaceae bacterium]